MRLRDGVWPALVGHPGDRCADGVAVVPRPLRRRPGGRLGQGQQQTVPHAWSRSAAVITPMQGSDASTARPTSLHSRGLPPLISLRYKPGSPSPPPPPKKVSRRKPREHVKEASMRPLPGPLDLENPSPSSGEKIIAASSHCDSESQQWYGCKWGSRDGHLDAAHHKKACAARASRGPGRGSAATGPKAAPVERGAR